MEAKTLSPPLQYFIIYHSKDQANLVDSSLNTVQFASCGKAKLSVKEPFLVPPKVDIIVFIVEEVTPAVTLLVEKISIETPCSIAIFSASKSDIPPKDLAQYGVNSVVEEVLPIDRLSSILLNAYARFSVINGLKVDLDKTKRKLDSVKIIEQAKMSLMKAKSMSEDEAYQLIRKTAMNNSQRIEDVARNILALEKMLAS